MKLKTRPAPPRYFAFFLLAMLAGSWVLLTERATADTAADISKASGQVQPAAGLDQFTYLPIIFRNYNFRLAYINNYRTLAGLPLLTESAEWSEGATLHARYIVKTNQPTNYQDPLTFGDWYTTQGADAAGNSVLAASTLITATNAQLIDFWMRSPFQALSLLDPELHITGYGDYAEADGQIVKAVVLDVRRGVSDAPAPTYPIMFPANGVVVNLRTYSGGDYPNPLAHPGCGGYTGLPIILQVGNGAQNVSLAPTNPTMISTGGAPQEHCVFHENNFSVPGDQTATDYGRSLLNPRDAIVIIPKFALNQAATYTVTVNALVNGAAQTYTWSFSVAAEAGP